MVLCVIDPKMGILSVIPHLMQNPENMVDGFPFTRETGLCGKNTALLKDEHHWRPLGSERFVAKLERILERNLQRLKPGPKPKNKRS